MTFKKMDEAVSDIVGTILLLGMAVLLFSVLSYVVLSYPATPSSASANLVGVIDDDYLMIEHRGGESLNLDTRVVLTISGSIPKSVSVGDSNYLSDEAKMDNHWGIGEWFVYQDDDMIGKQVDISVVDKVSNSVIMSGSLKST
jgi:hypothetical protein